MRNRPVFHRLIRTIILDFNNNFQLNTHSFFITPAESPQERAAYNESGNKLKAVARLAVYFQFLGQFLSATKLDYRIESNQSLRDSDLKVNIKCLLSK